MSRRPARFVPFLFVFILLVCIVVLLRSWWLPWLGYALIHNDGPAVAEIAVVLAGDYWGNRILVAGELVRAKYVQAALVSGPVVVYGRCECDLAIPYAVRHGFPANYFIPLPHAALSTRAEARVVLTELQRRNIQSFLLVTSDYHTARARRIFLAAEREAGGGPEFRTVATPDKFFQADSWWRTREGQKTAFMEWSKTIATMAGM